MGLWRCLGLSLWLAASPPVQEDLDQGAQAFGQGDYATALVEWSLALQQAREEGDAPAQIQALLGLSAANRQLGRLEEAQELAELAGEAGASEAQVGLAVGLVALDRGELKAAEKAFKRGFVAAQKAEHPALAADCANNLGLARLKRGQHGEALKAFDAALTLNLALDNARAAADVRNNRGLTLRRMGRLVEARGELEAAIAGFRATGDWGGEGDAMRNLGLVLQELGQHEAAGQLYEAALATARQRRDLRRQGVLLQALGTLDQQAGDAQQAATRYAAAEEAFKAAGADREALGAALSRASLGQDAGVYGQIAAQAVDLQAWSTAASASLNLGILRGEREPLESALELAEAHHLAQVEWRARYALGRWEIDHGETESGIAELRLAVDQLERTRRQLDAGSAQVFLVQYEQVYQALIDALLAQGDDLGAFVYAERLQLAGMDGAPIPQGPEALRYQALLEQEAALTQQLQVAESQGRDEQSQALREQLAALRVEFAATVDALRATYPDFDQLVRVDPEDLEAVQAELDPGVAVLQPILFEDRLVLLLVKNDSLRAVQVDSDPAEIRRNISRLTRSLRAQMIDQPEWTAGLADALGAALIAPIAPDLEGVEVLAVSASGPFQQLPFSLLRHDGQWLVEDLAVVNLTHVGSLRARGAATPRFVMSGPELLLVGNPDGSLPGAETEVQSIARRYPGATLVTGDLGGQQALLELSEGKRAVHLATHGVIDPTRPTRSYLVIGDAQQDGGRLVYGQIPGLAPWLSDTRLVVLSACESGLPVQAPDAPGDELAISIHGLSAQFQRAGVETLVASLWKVDDVATQALMEGFYGELAQGKDIAQALRGAQLQMLRGEQAHPWYWAGFLVAGDWR